MKKKIFFLIFLFLLAIFAAFVGYYNKEEIIEIFKTKPADKFNIPVFGWELKPINEDQVMYASDKGNIIVTIKKLNFNDLIQEIKKEFSINNWDSENNYFAKEDKICWITSDYTLICFNVNPIPPEILEKYKAKYIPDPDIFRKIFLEGELLYCGNGVIEEDLGENCEPPEYTELFGNNMVYICKTKYADFYGVKCSKNTCRCVIPSTDEDFLTSRVGVPLFPIPGPFCGDGIVNPPIEQCEFNAQCPVGWACAACRCVRPQPGAAKCGDGIMQRGEGCEWTPTRIPALLIPCPLGFTCQPPGSPKECTCLTEIKPKEGEEIPMPGEKQEEKEPLDGQESPEEKEKKCRKCKICSLEKAKAIVNEKMDAFSSILNSILISEELSEEAKRAILVLFNMMQLSEDMTDILSLTKESCDINEKLTKFLRKFQAFIDYLIQELEKSAAEKNIDYLEPFFERLQGFKFLLAQNLEKVSECSKIICELEKNGYWEKIDCANCEDFIDYSASIQTGVIG